MFANIDFHFPSNVKNTFPRYVIPVLARFIFESEIVVSFNNVATPEAMAGNVAAPKSFQLHPAQEEAVAETGLAQILAWSLLLTSSNRTNRCAEVRNGKQEKEQRDEEDSGTWVGRVVDVGLDGRGRERRGRGAGRGGAVVVRVARPDAERQDGDAAEPDGVQGRLRAQRVGQRQRRWRIRGRVQRSGSDGVVREDAGAGGAGRGPRAVHVSEPDAGGGGRRRRGVSGNGRGLCVRRVAGRAAGADADGISRRG